MKITALLIALALCLCAPALADTTFSGTVVAVETASVSAPFGGTTRDIALKKGDLVMVGDPIATIYTTRIFAPQEGTVSGVFAQPGDGAEAISTRYGAVLYIEPVNRYTVSASTDKAYNSSENRFISVGETVYLSCSKDGTHRGKAIVTKVDTSQAASTGNSTYALEVISGEFYMGEEVGIFRMADYDAKSRIGRGIVTQNAAIPIAGTGSVLKMHVQPGDRVERGEVLFETVDGVLDGLYALDNTIVSDVEGVVATVDVTTGGTVSKGANMITVYPKSAFRLEIGVSEMDLADIAEGDSVEIEFDFDADGAYRCEGIVESISHVSHAESGAAEYSAFITFQPAASVRLGMSAIAYVLDDPSPDDIASAEATASEASH